MPDFLTTVDSDGGKKEPQPVTLVSNGVEVAIGAMVSPDMETVAASQTDQVLGGAGAIGDVLTNLVIIPASISPGVVSIKDGSGSAVTIFAGGVSSLLSLVPVSVTLGATSTGGAWKVTTGANVSVVAFGNFT